MKRLLSILAALCWTTLGYAADYANAVDGLIPGLASQDVPARYAAQMELQDLASQSSRPGREADRADLSTVLARRAADEATPQPARAWILRQLEHMGGEEAVAALTGLLTSADPELRECARRALEKNPAPAATESLRVALEQSEATPWKIGLINSLAQRTDAKAVTAIGENLADAETGAAAAWALGRIASPDAVNALRLLLNRNPAAGAALIQAANRLLARGEQAPARSIYSYLYDRSTRAAERGAALTALTRIDPAGSAQRIGDALSGSDRNLRVAAIAAARDAGGTMLPTLVALFPQLTSPVKVQVVNLLGTTAERTVLGAVNDTDDQVRLAAVRRLGSIGTSTSVPVLLEVAADETRPGRSEAEQALVRLRGAGALLALREAANEGRPATRAAAIKILTTRQVAEVQPLLLECAEDPNDTVSRAALVALGKLGGDKEFVPVARITLERSSEDGREALESIASRVEDRETAAARLLALLGDNERAVVALLGVLGTLGGPDAMRVMQGVLTSDQAEAAIRALGKWPDLEAAKPLLEIAANSRAPSKQRALALQAAVRLVTVRESETRARRAEVVLAALAAAGDTDERRSVIAAMGAVPDAKVAAALKPFLVNEDLQAEAALAAVALAEELVKTDKATAVALAEAVRAINPPRAVDRRARAILGR